MTTYTLTEEVHREMIFISHEYRVYAAKFAYQLCKMVKAPQDLGLGMMMLALCVSNELLLIDEFEEPFFPRGEKGDLYFDIYDLKSIAIIQLDGRKES